jgi:hypothetical protein
MTLMTDERMSPSLIAQQETSFECIIKYGGMNYVYGTVGRIEAPTIVVHRAFHPSLKGPSAQRDDWDYTDQRALQML